MELRHLEYFSVIAQTGNLTKAAEHLGLTQPAISQSIKELEKAVGVELIARGTRGITLTDPGREFLKHTTEILERLPVAKQSARNAAIGIGGQVILGFTGSSIFDVLPAITQSVEQKMPEVDLRMMEMLTDRQVTALHGRLIDACVGRAIEHVPGIASHVLAQRSLILALHKKHPLAQKAQITLKDLQGLPLITPSKRNGPGFYEQLTNLLSKHHLHMQVKHEVMHLPTVVGLVAAGMGVGVMSDELLTLEVRDVVYRPLLEGKNALNLAISWRKDNHSSVVAKFVDVAIQACR